MGKLSNWTYLDLRANPLVTPPLEIAQKGIAAIRDYFEQLKPDSDYLQNEVVKLLGQIEAKIRESALADPIKNKALKNLNSTLDEVQEEEPSTEVLKVQLKRMTNTLTEAGKATAEGKKVWENVKPMLIQVAGWLKLGVEYF